jgi:hypothetical protein
MPVVSIPAAKPIIIFLGCVFYWLACGWLRVDGGLGFVAVIACDISMRYDQGMIGVIM